MKLLTYAAHNVLRIADIDFHLEGRHLFLVGGKNGQGKTSALTALLMALCGRSGMDWPEISLKQGETEGWVRVELSGDEDLAEPHKLTLELYLKKKRSGEVVEQFRILDSAGDEAPEPRTLLKRLYALKAFDPLAFERLERRHKKDLLMRLLGLDFTQEQEEHQKLYAERTLVNREGHKLKAQWEALPFHAEAPAEEVNTAELMQELERRQEQNAANQVQRDVLVEIEKRVSKGELKVRELREKIEDLQRQLGAALETVELAQARRVEQEQAVAKLQDEDETEIRQQIKDAGAVNARVRDNRRKREMEEQLDAMRKESADLTAQMQAIQERQAKALQEAEWPIEGLSFDEEGVLYRGLPFEQASRSQRIVASTKIGMALNPKLRLFVCQDGSDLDAQTLDALEQVLVEGDYQMLLELVSRSTEDEERCAVVIEDGRVKR